jgi:hypothetical protein
MACCENTDDSWTCVPSATNTHTFPQNFIQPLNQNPQVMDKYFSPKSGLNFKDWKLTRIVLVER